MAITAYCMECDTGQSVGIIENGTPSGMLDSNQACVNPDCDAVGRWGPSRIEQEKWISGLGELMVLPEQELTVTVDWRRVVTEVKDELYRMYERGGYVVPRDCADKLTKLLATKEPVTIRGGGKAGFHG